MFSTSRLTSASALVVLSFAVATTTLACDSSPEEAPDQDRAEATADSPESDTEDQEMDTDDPREFERQDERDAMVDDQVVGRGFDNENVLQALRTVPRHRFVPEEHARSAYGDRPLPIGHDQTVSQPYIVALMTDYLAVEPGDRVLEIGTGSGYQAAVLAQLGIHVYTIEIICELAEQAEADLQSTGYDTVNVKCGDGYEGWEEHAPYDGIIVTAAPPELPDDLLDQMADGARLVAPVGDSTDRQTMKMVIRDGDDFIERDLLDVRFVPMVPGRQGDED